MNKRFLVLGANGMLGHQVYLKAKEAGFDTKGTIREAKNTFSILADEDLFFEVDFLKDGFEKIETILAEFKPDIVLNCIGVIKQKKDLFKDEFILLNSYLPHKIAKLTNAIGGKFIQMSTDCIFTGKAGNYAEEDIPDAKDIYGLSKLLGEVTTNNNLTIRTSIIGHELDSKLSLFEWFKQNPENEVKGFKKAFFSGFTTNELAKILLQLIEKEVSGLLNVSTEGINKFDLLHIFNKTYALNKTIHPENEFSINRILNNSKFKKLNIKIKSYEEMVIEMKNEYQKK